MSNIDHNRKSLSFSFPRAWERRREREAAEAAKKPIQGQRSSSVGQEPSASGSGGAEKSSRLSDMPSDLFVIVKDFLPLDAQANLATTSRGFKALLQEGIRAKLRSLDITFVEGEGSAVEGGRSARIVLGKAFSPQKAEETLGENVLSKIGRQYFEDDLRDPQSSYNDREEKLGGTLLCALEERIQAELTPLVKDDILTRESSREDRKKKLGETLLGALEKRIAADEPFMQQLTPLVKDAMLRGQSSYNDIAKLGCTLLSAVEKRIAADEPFMQQLTPLVKDDILTGQSSREDRKKKLGETLLGALEKRIAADEPFMQQLTPLAKDDILTGQSSYNDIAKLGCTLLSAVEKRIRAEQGSSSS
jgi:hypothetical protein